MIEVFKTNVDKADKALQITAAIQDTFPHLNINFDLDDCDKILRVQGNTSIEQIKNIVESYNYKCDLL